jgi:hypothetical protein
MSGIKFHKKLFGGLARRHWAIRYKSGHAQTQHTSGFPLLSLAGCVVRKSCIEFKKVILKIFLLIPQRTKALTLVEKGVDKTEQPYYLILIFCSTLCNKVIRLEFIVTNNFY